MVCNAAVCPFQATSIVRSLPIALVFRCKYPAFKLAALRFNIFLKFDWNVSNRIIKIYRYKKKIYLKKGINKNYVGVENFYI